MRQPLAGRGGGALFGDPGEAAGREQVLPAGEFGGEPGEQAGGALVLGAGDHRAAMGKAVQRQQRPVAAVETVQVGVGALNPTATAAAMVRSSWERPDRGAPAAIRWPKVSRLITAGRRAIP